MPAQLKLTNKKFGKLKVIKFLEMDNFNQSKWLCKCNCGKEWMVSGAKLKSGHTKSCGCSRINDLKGKKFGKLKVISFFKIKKDHTYWKCLCNCGRNKVIESSRLVLDITKSCGWLHKFPKGEAMFNRLIKHYKRKAKMRSLAFNLNTKQIKKLMLKNCYYCGLEPSNEYGRKDSNGVFKYSGIDRINNNHGYSVKNCVPCCKNV